MFVQNAVATQAQARILRASIVAVAIAAISLVGCGDDGEDHENQDTTISGVYQGDGGLSVDAAFTPDPPRQGGVELSLEIFVDDQPLEGAQLEVEPWMPSHGHGSNTVATVVDEGDGLYRVDDLSFSMPGHWELKLVVEWEEKSSTLVWDIDVEG